MLSKFVKAKPDGSDFNLLIIDSSSFGYFYITSADPHARCSEELETPGYLI